MPRCFPADECRKLDGKIYAESDEGYRVKIKLLVCCHQNVSVPEHPLLVPMQVGAALAQQRFPGFLYDDVGENISDKNKSYCELTALYWAWKNLDADYYGLFHYRRYLYPCETARRPYRIEKRPTAALCERLGYGRFAKFIFRYDMIMPKGEQMYVSVRQHYANAPFHHAVDLALIEEIILEKHPEMTEAMETYLGGTVHYFGNIAIMTKDIFHSYCEWLFGILAEYDRRSCVQGYSGQETRVNGYLAERLLGVYYTAAKMQGDLRTAELPKVHFVEDFAARSKQKLVATLLPPSSRIRSVVKKLVGQIRTGK